MTWRQREKERLKSRIGHDVEAQILEACEVDYIDESEAVTMADEDKHIDKTQFKVPFVCGCRDLGTDRDSDVRILVEVNGFAECWLLIAVNGLADPDIIYK